LFCAHLTLSPANFIHSIQSGPMGPGLCWLITERVLTHFHSLFYLGIAVSIGSHAQGLQEGFEILQIE